MNDLLDKPVSARQYDLFFVALHPEGHMRFEDVLHPVNGLIPELRKQISNQMKTRCTEVRSAKHGACTHRIPPVRGKGGVRRWRTGFSKGHECWNRYLLNQDDPEFLERSLPTFLWVLNGRPGILALVESPGQSWSRVWRSELAARSEVSSIIGVPLHRYKTVSFRDETGSYVRDFHRFRVSRRFSLVTFVTLQHHEDAPDYCRELVWGQEDGSPKLERLNSWKQALGRWMWPSENLPGVHLLYGKCQAEPQQFMKAVEDVDPHRMEVFLTLNDRHHVLVKAEFNSLGKDLFDHVTMLRKTGAGAVSTESFLCMNPNSPDWDKGGRPFRSVVSNRYRLVIRLLCKRTAGGKAAGQSFQQVLDNTMSECGVKVKTPLWSAGRTPQYYDYCLHWENIARASAFRNAVRALSKMTAKGIDVISVPHLVPPGGVSLDLPLGNPTGDREPAGPPSLKRQSRPYPPIMGTNALVNAWSEDETGQVVTKPVPGKQLMEEFYRLHIHAEWLQDYAREARYVCRSAFGVKKFAPVFDAVDRLLNDAVEEISKATELIKDASDHGTSFEMRPARLFHFEAERRLYIAENILDVVENMIRGNTDVSQALTLSSPRAISFERTGAMNLHLRAGEKVLRRFLRPWDARGKTVLRLCNVKHENGPVADWNGIIWAGLGKELCTFAQASVVLLPSLVSYESHRVYPLIAHEAGHILWSRVVAPTQGRPPNAMASLKTALGARPVPEEEKRALVRAMASLEAAFTLLAGRNPDKKIRDKLVNWLLRLKKANSGADYTRIIEEAFCDLFASLMAGPAFGLSLLPILPPTSTDSSPQSEYLGTEARLIGVAELCTVLRYSKAWGYLKAVAESFPGKKRFSSTVRAEVKLARDFVRFLVGNGDTLPAGVPRWDDRKTRTCCEIAKTLAWSDSLALRKSWSPELVAAAAQLEDYFTPLYPDGRVTLSIANAKSP